MNLASNRWREVINEEKESVINSEMPEQAKEATVDEWPEPNISNKNRKKSIFNWKMYIFVNENGEKSIFIWNVIYYSVSDFLLFRKCGV